MNKIAILYICTGNYNVFWKDFYLSCEKYFLNDLDENGNKKFEKEYFIWTDSEYIKKDYAEYKNIKINHIDNRPWPENTLFRFEIFLTEKENIEKCDCVFYINANALFLKDIKESDVLPNNNQKIIAVSDLQIPTRDTKGERTYCRNKQSFSYIPKGSGDFYFNGRFQGGFSKDYMIAASCISKLTRDDWNNKVIATWHDESHWNRYLIYKDDIKILPYTYLTAEEHFNKLNESYKKEIKIMYRDKSKYFNDSIFKFGLFWFIKYKIKQFIKKILNK